MHFQNTDKNNISASTVLFLKLKQKKNMKKKFLRFVFQSSKMLFFGGSTNFFKFFFFSFSFLIYYLQIVCGRVQGVCVCVLGKLVCDTNYIFILNL